MPRTRRQLLSQWAEEREYELVFFDPPKHFDHAIIGIIHGYGQEPAILYDEDQVLTAMMKDGLTLEDAADFFEFNTIGAYVGDATPRFLLVRPKEIT